MGAVAGAIGSIASGAIGAIGSSKAGKQQAAAQEQATAEQRRMFKKTRKDLKPFRKHGEEALNLLMGRMDEFTDPFMPTMEQLEATPGYQFARDQGLRGVQHSAAARGLGASGPALAGAAEFATGHADTTFGNQMQRELGQRELFFNMLMGPAGLGQAAAAQQAAATGQASQGIAATIAGAGDARAAGTAGMFGALGQGIQGAANAYSQHQQMQQMMNMMGGGGRSSPRGLY